MPERTIARWRGWDGDGLEHLVLREGPQAIVAGAVVLATEDGEPYAARYRIACDPAWRVTSLLVELLGEGRGIELAGSGEGHWRDAAGKPLPALAGAIDVDLSATPFTNTLPIRRLRLSAGQQAEILVAYVRLPELALSAERQRYTCLEPGRRYRFEALDTGFVRDLEVDSRGLVLEYPGLFRRTH